MYVINIYEIIQTLMKFQLLFLIRKQYLML